MVEEVYRYGTDAANDIVNPMGRSFRTLAEELKTRMLPGQRCFVTGSVERNDGAERDKKRLSSALGESLGQFELEVKDISPAEGREMYELWVTKR